ncbi:hypothetical protein PILCRDRAFT_687077 [Piloderma croceum F 1598]|uniref:Uncharacterized protein n=1 Tax=Piloderma croceum (strain F 1598) TaxID=765440 RepID=A0A0C3BCL1_PILCF|nr:hypothetical protein PILCRDRAFT_687077 [Piloderma croceum F 1598]
MWVRGPSRLIHQFRSKLHDGSHAERHFDRDRDNLGQFWHAKSFHFILLLHAGRFTIYQNAYIPIVAMSSCTIPSWAATCNRMKSKASTVFTSFAPSTSHPIELSTLPIHSACRHRLICGAALARPSMRSQTLKPHSPITPSLFLHNTFQFYASSSNSALPHPSDAPLSTIW